MSRMNKDELSAMKRSELQKEAKKLGIKANQASNLLIQQILEKNNVRLESECHAQIESEDVKDGAETTQPSSTATADCCYVVDTAENPSKQEKEVPF